MHDIPGRASLIVPARTGIVIPESVEGCIPYGRELLNQQCLAQRNPNVVNHEKSAAKIVAIQIRRVIDGLAVLGQAVVERSARRDVQSQAATPRASESPCGKNALREPIATITLGKSAATNLVKSEV